MTALRDCLNRAGRPAVGLGCIGITAALFIGFSILVLAYWR